MTDDWFRRRTTTARVFDADDLVAAKRRQGLRVSLVIPARDEAATVGTIVRRVRQRLCLETPLLDELVVIDSDSADTTREAAEEAGATVYRSADIRPDLGSSPGKGEAIWKSLFVATGDLLVFMDADLTEWDTHFVTGLVGPLLGDPATMLVKGFYQRPLQDAPASGDHQPLQGGRVTELVARPLLALRWPELSGVVQPLAGEWAARRSLLEELAVPVGYGVELAVLVDTYLRTGLSSMAQVDLGVRGHRHQPLSALGRMAVELVAVTDRRAGGPSGLGSVDLRQYDVVDGSLLPAEHEVDLQERAPAASVPGYRADAPARRSEA